MPRRPGKGNANAGSHPSQQKVGKGSAKPSGYTAPADQPWDHHRSSWYQGASGCTDSEWGYHGAASPEQEEGSEGSLQVCGFTKEHLELASTSLPTSGRVKLPWALLCLSESPKINHSEAALRWRLHCVGVKSRVADFWGPKQNRWELVAGNHRDPHLRMRTGVADVHLSVERGAILRGRFAKPRDSSHGVLSHLHISGSFSVGIQHRQPEVGLRCLCPGAAAAVDTLSKQQQLPQHQQLPAEPLQADTVEGYTSLWRSPLELEAASRAVGESGGRRIFDVWVEWQPCTGTGESAHWLGTMDVPALLMRVHRIKFRSCLRTGEWASSWLCMSRATHKDGPMEWSGHAAVQRVWLADEDRDVIFGDEDDAWLDMGSRNIRVQFSLVESSSQQEPRSGYHLMEIVPKSLADSCMALALSELPRADLAKALVLVDHGVPPLPRLRHDADVSAWGLNPSQHNAVCEALVKPLILVQGPPGTGKTRTTAVLATVFATQNLNSGENRAVLFCAPTNRAVDCAAAFVWRMCLQQAQLKLSRQLDMESPECVICFNAAPDMVTACGHVFCKECLRQALQSSSRCPICRQPVKHPDSGLRILRVYGADAEKQEFPVPRKHDHPVDTRKPYEVPEDMRRFALHWRCHAAVAGEMPTPEAVACQQAYKAMLEHGTHGPKAESLHRCYQQALKKARAAELRDADLVFTTCVSCRRMAIVEALEEPQAPTFRQVIIDEAGQAIEPEVLCPLTCAMSAHQICLFGDHQQLRPIISSHAAEMAGLSVSLFERLARGHANRENGLAPFFLAQQYRMHPDISCFPSTHFYGGRVLDDDSVVAQPAGILEHPCLPGKVAALLMWDDAEQAAPEDAGEEVQAVRTADSGACSRKHMAEASRAAEVALALTARAGPGSVGVLSWYNAQVVAISELLGEHTANIHVGSVSTAQGSEWDYVVLSTVRRGGPRGRLGIVSDPHILNVALTRARLGLVVLGHQPTLSHDSNWARFLEHCSQRSALLAERPAVTTEEARLEAAWERALRKGLLVVIHGLRASPELNGQYGTIVSHRANDQGRWEVEVSQANTARRLALKSCNLRWEMAEVKPKLQEQEQKPARSFAGLSSLVSDDRPGGTVEFSKRLSLKSCNLDMSQSPSTPISRGAKVKLKGLQSMARYNGLVGTVRSQTANAEGRWEVEISVEFCMGKSVVEARPGRSGLETKSQGSAAPRQLLSNGTIVLLHGLNAKAEYNGEWGAITSDGPNADERYEVEITYGGETKRLLLKPENLAPQVLSR